MNRVIGVLAAASLAVLAAGCGGTSDGGGADQTPATAARPAVGAELAGRSFVSTGVVGTEIPGGGPLVLDFTAEGTVGATAGCNRMFGPVELAGGKLVAGQLASTMMACLPPHEGADEWASSFLSGGPEWSLDGDTLTLTSGPAVVTLTDKKVADPDRPVAGTQWVLTTLVTADAASTSAALEAAAPTLLIGEDGAVSGSTGCNSFSGAATVGEDTVTFGPLASTLVACADPDLDEAQTLVLTVLAGQTTVAVDGPTMRITAADGVNGLGYRAAG